MGDPGQSDAVARRFSQAPASAAAGRRFAADALAEVPSDLAHTAQPLVGELVTNAVLHAHIHVEVWVRVHGGRMRVETGDERPGRGLVPQDPPATPAPGRAPGPRGAPGVTS